MSYVMIYAIPRERFYVLQHMSREATLSEAEMKPYLNIYFILFINYLRYNILIKYLD